MHVSKIEVGAINADQVDAFYHQLIALFPSRANDLHAYMNDMDKDGLPPQVQWLNLLTFAFDWANYGN